MSDSNWRITIRRLVPAHRIGYNAIFDLPFGRGKKFGSGATGVLNQIIGGWQVATIGDWRGGYWRSLDCQPVYIWHDPGSLCWMRMNEWK